MSDRSNQIAVVRDIKRRFHMRRARFWKIPLMIANGLFPLTLLFIAAPFLHFGLFVDEVLINHKYSKISQVLYQFLMSLALVPAMISFGWWVLVCIRELRNKHLRLAAGYAQLSAEEMLAKARSGGHTFGLFLRGFEAEAASTTYYGPNPEVGSREAQISARYVEALVVEMLREDVPVVALADPRDPEPMAGVYRFEKVPAQWEQFINELLPDAFPIVMHLTSFTPGIRAELDLISSPSYSSKAGIIVSRSLAIRNSPEGRILLQSLSCFRQIVFEQIDKDWSREREAEFHARLQESLRALERDSQSAQIIMKKEGGNFTLITLSRRHRLLNFMKGPFLVVSMLTAPVIVMTVFNVQVRWSEIGLLFVLWLGGVIALSALKGLAYILGFAQSAGDNKLFPTFSRMMRWAKRHSVTPK